MHAVVFLLLLLMVAIIIYTLIRRPREPYCGMTPFLYGEIDELPDDIAVSNKSPPFYDLNGRHEPLCAYRNYTMPPPIDYPPVRECPDIPDRYQYWNDSTLSHPWTPYVI
jgi:hypothetical protein